MLDERSQSPSPRRGQNHGAGRAAAAGVTGELADLFALQELDLDRTLYASRV